MSQHKRILYFINDLFGGGAQKGLINLLEAGFFKDTELHIASIIRGDGRIAQELAKYLPASHIHQFSSSEKMRLKHLILALIRYPLLLILLRPQVVILSLPQANLVGRFWGHLLPFFKVYAFEHNIAYAKKSYAYLLKALSLSVTGIISDTQKTAQETSRRFFLPWRSYKVIELPLYTGNVNPNHVKSSTKLAPPVRLLIAGRLAQAKNHAGLFEALKLLKDKGLAFHLSVVGEGDFLPALKTYAETLGLTEDITFHGYLMPWTAQCPLADIYLQPSFREGLCITVVEAMRHGLPVIASPVGGMLDYGRDGENILFCDPESPASIAAKIGNLVSNDELRQKMSKNAISSMDELYGNSATQKKLAAAREIIGF